MQAYVIKNALLGMALFAATAAMAVAQDQDSLQPPAAPLAPLSPLLPQVRELNVAPFIGGTYLGVSLAEKAARRRKRA